MRLVGSRSLLLAGGSWVLAAEGAPPHGCTPDVGCPPACPGCRRETALPPSERFWRTVRSQWTPMLDTWRPRVNGVQLKVGGRMGGRGLNGRGLLCCCCLDDVAHSPTALTRLAALTASNCQLLEPSPPAPSAIGLHPALTACLRAGSHAAHATCPPTRGDPCQVLAGARLPESEEEWAALRTALAGVRQHLRPDSSLDLVVADLRDFVQMVVSWWENRKKTDAAGEGPVAPLGVAGRAGRHAGGV